MIEKGTKKLITSQIRNKHPWRKWNPFLLSDFYSEDQKNARKPKRKIENESGNIG